MHDIIMLFLTVIILIAIAGVGHLIGENTLKGSVPHWVCYAGFISSVFCFGFFQGVFKP